MTAFTNVLDFDACIECKPGFEKVLLDITDTESVLFLDERGTQDVIDPWFFKSDIACEAVDFANFVQFCEYYYDDNGQHECFKCRNGYTPVFEFETAATCATGTQPDCNTCNAGDFINPYDDGAARSPCQKFTKITQCIPPPDPSDGCELQKFLTNIPGNIERVIPCHVCSDNDVMLIGVT